jgi:Putative DNA-binding domain
VSLLDLQRRMSEDVRRPLTPDFKMQTVTEKGLSTSEIAAGYIRPNPLLTSFERLEIYNRQYWFRVIGAVSEDYPALNAVLGPKRFDTLVRAYLEENPSTSFTLRDLGGKLPIWLAAHPEYGGTRRHLAVDVARLEWAYVEAFDKASVPPLGEADLAGLLPDSTLLLQPHLQLLDLRYPVDEVVLAVRKNTPEIDIVSNAVADRKTTTRASLPSIRRSPVYLAVHRFDNSVYYRLIDREAFLLLAALRDGHSITTAIEKAFAQSRQQPEQQASKIREYFAHAAELGWFTATEPDRA